MAAEGSCAVTGVSGHTPPEPVSAWNWKPHSCVSVLRTTSPVAGVTPMSSRGKDWKKAKVALVMAAVSSDASNAFNGCAHLPSHKAAAHQQQSRARPEQDVSDLAAARRLCTAGGGAQLCRGARRTLTTQEARTCPGWHARLRAHCTLPRRQRGRWRTPQGGSRRQACVPPQRSMRLRGTAGIPTTRRTRPTPQSVATAAAGRCTRTQRRKTTPRAPRTCLESGSAAPRPRCSAAATHPRTRTPTGHSVAGATIAPVGPASSPSWACEANKEPTMRSAPAPPWLMNAFR